MTNPPPVTAEQVAEWFAHQVPDGWFTEPPRAHVDRDEIIVVGTLHPPTVDETDEPAETDPSDEPDEPADQTDADEADTDQPGEADEPTDEPADETDESDGARPLAEQSHIAFFREHTRKRRVHIALRAEALFRRKVSWVVECGQTRQPFTTLSAPVMTRLRMSERRILDTLVAAGVARSRSDALAWCVRLVGEHEGDWIDELRDALDAVEQVRARRPGRS